MNIQSFIPSVVLRPYIKTFLIIECEEELVNRVLPGTAPVIAFRFKGTVNYITENTVEALPASMISGLRKSVRLINYTKDSGNLLVQFREGGIAAFSKQPVHELFEESIALANLFPATAIANLEEQLALADTHVQRIHSVEAFLQARLSGAKDDTLVMAALQQIHLHHGDVKMKELAAQLFISQDAFEKRFRKVVGTTPKQFASLIKMQLVVQQKHALQSLTETAYEGGYFDQAHFNKAFKNFTGLTPSEFFRSKPLW